MWKAEQDKALSEYNYRGWKKLRAMEVSLNQCLMFDSIWGKRGRVIVISNDAKGCYDHITHIVAYMCMCQLGALKATLWGIIEAIQSLKHYIRTAFGDSKWYYGADPNKPPLQGLLQGNAMAPPGWLAVSTVITKAMKQEGFGYDTWSMTGNRAITSVAFKFVDDSDLAISDDSVDAETLILKAQRMLHTWEGLLEATGGALAPHKSYWYLVDVVYCNGAWQYKTKDETPGEMFLWNGGDHYFINRLDVWHAKEVLGIQV